MTTQTELTPAPAVAARRSGRKWTVIRWASPLVLLALWQLGSALGVIPQDVLPAPSLIIEAGIELIENGQLADALAVSGVRVVEGLLLGGILGVALGTAVGLSRWFEATVDPPMQMVRALPHLGLIPLFIIWFGIGELPKVLLFAESKQIAGAPKFDDWVDRRYSDALNPLLINR